MTDSLIALLIAVLGFGSVEHPTTLPSLADMPLEQKAAKADVDCHIASLRRGMETKAIVSARAPAKVVAGARETTVEARDTRGNSIVIVDSGNFAAAPGKPVELSRVRMAGDDLRYDVRTKLGWADGSTACRDAHCPPPSRTARPRLAADPSPPSTTPMR